MVIEHEWSAVLLQDPILFLHFFPYTRAYPEANPFLKSMTILPSSSFKGPLGFVGCNDQGPVAWIQTDLGSSAS
jgi:hypothetical protein